MTRLLPAALAFLLLALPSPADAQIVASERGTVRQVVDGTVIEVDYARPTLRGRTHIFDTEVPRNLLWTPGADMATTIAFSNDVHVNGTPVPAGIYSMWMVTNRAEWQVVLDPDTAMFHLPHPEPDYDQIAFTATADTTAPHMETLAFLFPEVHATGTTLRMHWERTAVDMDIRVPPSRDLTIAAADAAPYLGLFDVTVEPGPFGPGHHFELDLTHDGEYLAGTLDLGADWGGLYPTYFAPAADQIFNPVWIMNGRIAGVFEFMFVEFVIADGRAVSFQMRGPDDSLWMRGTRLASPGTDRP